MNKVRFGFLIFGFILILSNLLLGMPVNYISELWGDKGNIAKAAGNFSMQTGYYMGNGGNFSITGLGFAPESVIVKSVTSTGQAAWKTTSMPSSNFAFLSATADNTGSAFTLTSDGFNVANNNSNLNAANVRYQWVAFAGSDCSSAGTVCLGTFTGNAAASRKITTGFQPSFVMVKRSTAVGGNFKTASMAANTGQYFATTAAVTDGTMFSAIQTDGFNVGSLNNASTGIYYYIAFKSVSGIMTEGTFTGDGTDNRNITGFGNATPSFAIVKNATSATVANRNAIATTNYNDGDYAGYLASTTANGVNLIQALQNDGFQVGSNVNVNELSQTIYWVAFAGATNMPSGTDTFNMQTGTYTGNGTTINVTGLSFAPDLVIIKDNAVNYAVFRTSQMTGDTTAYLANAASNITTAITSLNSDGFTVGSSTVVNTATNVYQWQAFGNAYKPSTFSGAADFAVGAYYGNSVDTRNITAMPFQPDLVVIKRSGATAGTFRTSSHSGDSSSFFTATADGTDRLQAFNTNGFQVGTTNEVNAVGNIYYWFAFKNGSNFATGSYTGTGAAQNVAVGFAPESVWVKRNASTGAAVYRSSSLSGDATQYFSNLANATGKITSLISTGFSVTGTAAETNASAGVFRYAAWKPAASGVLITDIVDSNDNSVASPSVSFGGVNSLISCQSSTGTLGSSSQKIRVDNGTSNGNWSLTIAATGGSTASWSNGTNIFDFNDGNGSPTGCSDGGDSDSAAGQLSIDASVGSLTPRSGCSSSGVTKGSASAFSEGVVNSISLLVASGSQTSCYYDLTGVQLSQQIPGETPSNASPYLLNMTITVTAN